MTDININNAVYTYIYVYTVDVELHLRAFSESFILIQKIPSSCVTLISCTGTHCFLFIDLSF